MQQERLMVLEKALSGLPGYRGWMIGKCHFSLEGKENQWKHLSICSRAVILMCCARTSG